jgi:hypothetical protein
MKGSWQARRYSSVLRWQVPALVALLWLPACSSSPGKPSPTLTGVTVSGTQNLTAVGQATQLTATAVYSDGSNQNVTNSATWQSSNSSVAGVSPGGVVTAVNFGQASITATYQSANGPLVVTVQLNLAGTWKGSSADSTGMLNLSFVLLQNGSTLTGTGTYSGGASGTGTFTGTVSTTSNIVNFSIGGTGGGCTFTATGVGAVVAKTFSGSYTGNNSCYGPLANGVVALTEQ